MHPTQSNGSNARVCSTTCPCALVITSRTRCRRSSREMTSLKPSGWQPQPGWYSFMPYGNSKRDWCSWLFRCTQIYMYIGWYIYISFQIHIHVIINTYCIDSYMKKIPPSQGNQFIQKNGKSFWVSPSCCRGRVHVSFYMSPWLRMCHMTISAALFNFNCPMLSRPCIQNPDSQKAKQLIRPGPKQRTRSQLLSQQLTARHKASPKAHKPSLVRKLHSSKLSPKDLRKDSSRGLVRCEGQMIRALLPKKESNVSPF